MTEEVVSEYQVSVSRACQMMRLPKSQYYYQSKKDDKEVIVALQQLAEQHPSYGFRKLFAYIRRSGHSWNHKKVYRVYRLLKLNKKRKGKRRLPNRVKHPLQQQAAINQSWSMDFMSDSLVNGRKFRTLNVIDDCNREALAIEVDTSLSAKRVIRTLEQVITWRGKPQVIRVDYPSASIDSGQYIIDINDSNKRYYISSGGFNCRFKDKTPSTYADSMAGSFTIALVNNGTTYPATGSFNIRH